MAKSKFLVTANRPLTKRTGKKKGHIDSVDVQFSVVADVPRGKILAPAVIEEAIKYKAATGVDPQGFTIKVTQWRNPDRKRGRPDDTYTLKSEVNGGRGWRTYGTQRDRWNTLGRAIRSPHTKFTVTVDRDSQGKE